MGLGVGVEQVAQALWRALQICSDCLQGDTSRDGVDLTALQLAQGGAHVSVAEMVVASCRFDLFSLKDEVSLPHDEDPVEDLLDAVGGRSALADFAIVADGTLPQSLDADRY